MYFFFIFEGDDVILCWNGDRRLVADALFVIASEFFYLKFILLVEYLRRYVGTFLAFNLSYFREERREYTSAF